MAIVGYARVSSAGQSLDIQLEQLAACDRVFSEKESGSSTRNRPALAECLAYVREGDVLMVTRLDRLARSVTDLRNIIDQLAAKGVGFKALQQGEIDTTSPTGKLMLNMLAAFAEFENDLRRDRQADGIAKAKARGAYKGRPATTPADQVRAKRAAGARPVDIARDLGISIRSVYRALGQSPTSS
jgi:DNA invertase Pin-like site-specific DNA recombinase